MEWMDLEPDPTGCKFDALTISDFNSSVVDYYCGSKSYFPIISKTKGSQTTYFCLILTNEYLKPV